MASPDWRANPAGAGDAVGERAPWPDIIESAQARAGLVRLAFCHRAHDPRNNNPGNLLALCQRCHMIHDRPYHLMRRRLRYLLRYALGDLFWGPYPRTPGAALPSLVRGG